MAEQEHGKPSIGDAIDELQRHLEANRIIGTPIMAVRPEVAEVLVAEILQLQRVVSIHYLAIGRISACLGLPFVACGEGLDKLINLAVAKIERKLPV